MTGSTNSSQGFSPDSFDIFVFIYKKRKPLAIIGAIAAIASLIVSLTITPLFESEVILYPAENQSVGTNLLNTQLGDLSEFGDNEFLEAALQSLQSNWIRDQLVERFDLVNHYELNPKDPRFHTYLLNKYSKLFKYSSTTYSAIKITVRDWDPKLAAEMANTVIDLLNQQLNNMRQSRAKTSAHIMRLELADSRKMVADVVDSLKQITKLGINDYESQSERFNEAYAKAIAEGNMAGAKRLEEKMAVFAEHGPTFIYYKYWLEMKAEQMTILEKRLKEATIDAEAEFPYSFVVKTGEVSDKKAYPKKSIIMLVSTLSAVVMAIIALILVENIKKLKLQ